VKPTACWIRQYLCNNNSIKSSSVQLKKRRKRVKQIQIKKTLNQGNLYNLDNNIQVNAVRRRGERKNVYINLNGMELISNIRTVPRYYRIWLRKTIFVLNTSESLQTTLAADAHLPEGQFLIEGLKLNIEKSPRYRVGTRRLTASKREGQYFNTFFNVR
jgi:hypothetical protein